MRSNLGLSALPGELQEQIILNLHPSAAIALRQTNHYFQTIVSLHRFEVDQVWAFLKEKQEQPHNAKHLACYFCLCLKPRSLCLNSRYIALPQCYVAPPPDSQSCLDCAVKTGRVLPGNINDLANQKDKLLFCIACLNLQSHFCEKCRWCIQCAERRMVNTYRKDEMGYRVVPIFDRCWEHEWHHNDTSRSISLVKSDRLLRLQTQAVRNFETTNVGPASFDSAEGARLEELPVLSGSTKQWGLRNLPKTAPPRSRLPQALRCLFNLHVRTHSTNHQQRGQTSSHVTSHTNQDWQSMGCHFS